MRMPKALEILLYVLIPVSFGLIIEEISHRLTRKSAGRRRESDA
jgi:predicted Na+-dependent transporter